MFGTKVTYSRIRLGLTSCLPYLFEQPKYSTYLSLLKYFSLYKKTNKYDSKLYRKFKTNVTQKYAWLT